MAKLTIVVTGDDHLASLDDDWLSCKGDRHDFPKLRVGPLPAGVTAAHAGKTGVYQLTYTCPDCGTVRTKTTQRGGIVATSKYSYKHPPGYIAPPGAGLTKTSYASELGRRAAPHIRAAARSNAKVTAG